LASSIYNLEYIEKEINCQTNEIFNSLDHIVNKCEYNRYLKKFIIKCIKYDIKFFTKRNNTGAESPSCIPAGESLLLQREVAARVVTHQKGSLYQYHILNISHIYDQINILKTKIITLNIDELNNLLKTNIVYDSYEVIVKKSDKYLKILKDFDKFISITNIVYEKDLFKLDKINNINHDKNIIYNNLVNLSKLDDNYLKIFNKGIILIDDYNSISTSSDKNKKC